MIEHCQHLGRYPGEPSGYLAWREWAEEKAKTHEQHLCPHCKLWAIWELRAELDDTYEPQEPCGWNTF